MRRAPVALTVARPATVPVMAFVAMALMVLVLLVAVLTMAAGTAVAAASGSVEPDDGPPPTVNEYYPAERSLSDCVSALPKPGCGSEARGGFHQAAVFGVLLVGLGAIGARIAISVRRRDAARLAAADRVDIGEST